MTAADHTYAGIGISAISDDSPCGENARYEPEFEALEAELAKQESLTSATVDWTKIVDTAAQITQNKSKDILVGSYLCYGLLLKEGYTGLSVGLKVLGDMCETHWDCLFPPAKRMRARATAFVWLAEKAGNHIGTSPPSANDGPAVIEALEFFRKLDGALVEKMGDQAPMLNDLSKPLKAYAQSAQAEAAKAAEPAPPPPQAAVPAPEQATEPAHSAAAPAQTANATPAPVPAPVAPVPAASAQPAVASSAKTLQTGDLQSEADSKKQIRQIQSACRDVAAFWLQQKLSDPRAYRLARQAAWMTVENAPPANDGITQIMPPPAERLKFFDGKMENKEFSALLPELEKTLSRGAFWLDGQFMVAQILKSLGPEYEAALKTVISELSSLVGRMPELLEMSFSDQTPFASDQTRLWIESEVLLATTEGGGKSASATSAAGEAWTQALTDAAKKAASGDATEAIAMMHIGMQQAGSPRARMYWRCALAELSMQTGGNEAATDILEQVAAQLSDNPVADWEPELPAYTYRLLHQSYQKQLKKTKDNPELKIKAQQAYDKLCWFDPVTALSERGG